MVVGFSLECGGLMVDDEVKNVQDDHHEGQRGIENIADDIRCDCHDIADLLLPFN